MLLHRSFALAWRRHVYRTTHSRRLHADDSIRARDGGHNMDLASHQSAPCVHRHRRGAQTHVAMHVTVLTSACNCSAVMSVHGTDSHSARYMHVAPISSTSLIISHQVDACSTVTAPRVLQQRQAGAITPTPASVSTMIAVQRPGLELVDLARIRRLIFRLSTVARGALPR